MRDPQWTPPPEWRRITTIDAHTAGEPFRVIITGLPELRGKTILDRRRWARQHLDELRRGLMWEPRGHADMYGCIVTPPVTEEADLGVLFLHNEGYSTMCGHGIIALATVVLQTGMLAISEPQTQLVIDTPAGRVGATARIADGRVTSVAFRNVPSFVLALDESVEVPGVGLVTYDLAFGGAFYAVVEAASVGLRCEPEALPRLVEIGRAIKRALAASRPTEHPFGAEMSFLYGVIFVEPSGPGVHSRNVCVFADGEVDRSPTGTGVSARLAIHHHRGDVRLGETIVIESVVGSRFSARVVETTRFGPHDAVVPEVEGSAYITGRHEFLFDPEDPLRHGFLLR